MSNNSNLLLFILNNFGLSGILLFGFALSAVLLFIPIKAIKNKKISHLGGESKGVSATIIGVLTLTTVVVIIIALVSAPL